MQERKKEIKKKESKKGRKKKERRKERKVERKKIERKKKARKEERKKKERKKRNIKIIGKTKGNTSENNEKQANTQTKKKRNCDLQDNFVNQFISTRKLPQL